MIDQGCDREYGVLELLATGRWPDGCDPELRDHVKMCVSCRDLSEVAGALLEDRAAILTEAVVPGSGLVWWRMQMRARREAARTASRTVTALQTIAICVALAIALTLIGVHSVTGSRAWLTRLAELVTLGSTHASSVSIIAQYGAPLFLALAIWLALAPIAVWFAVTDD